LVVGVLQRGLFTVQEVSPAETGQDGGGHRFADLASLTAAVLLQQPREVADALDPDDLVQFGAGVGEVLAQAASDLGAGSFQLLRDDTSTSLMQLPQPVPALVHFLTWVRVVQPVSRTAAAMVPLATLWQEQITVSSGQGERADGPAESGGQDELLR